MNTFDSDHNESPLYLVLDGGGARGIAHVAMWRALEQLVAKPFDDQPGLPKEYGAKRYRLSGVAGTSAGAIAAAFIAAGATSYDLIDDQGRSPLCTPLGLKYFHALFGIRGMRRIRFIRRFQALSVKLKKSLDTLTKEVDKRANSKTWAGSALANAGPVKPVVENAKPASVEEHRKRARLFDVNDAPSFAGETSIAKADTDHSAAKNNDDDSASRIKKIIALARLRLWNPFVAFLLDPFVAFPVILVFLPILYFYPIKLIDRLNSTDFKPPYSLLFVLVIVYSALVITSRVARGIEKRRTAERRRSYERFEELALHPLASFVYALIFSTIVGFFIAALVKFFPIFSDGQFFSFLDFSKETEAFSSFLTSTLNFPPTLSKLVVRLPVGLLYSAISLACGYSCVHYVRNLVKGGIDPDDIEGDINEALRTLITQTARSWDQNLSEHLWVDRSNLNETQRIILANRMHQVTFDDIYQVTGIDLTVVAADAVGNRFVTFNRAESHGLSVAKAVTASLAIPFVFRFVRHRKSLLVDGGLVSSIPAWVFRRERNRDPDSRILAVRIDSHPFDDWLPQFLKHRQDVLDEAEKAQLKHWEKAKFFWRYSRLSLAWPFSLLGNIASTALFGARALELDASDRLESIVLTPNLGLLDFDVSSQRAKSEVDKLCGTADQQIRTCLWLREVGFRDACAEIERDLRSLTSPNKHGRPYIRIFLARRDGQAESLRIRLTYNFDRARHFDDRIVMPFSTSVSTLAFQTKKSQYAEKKALIDLRAGRINRYRSAVIWPEIEWCWAIPILRNEGDKEPLAVIAIECNETLAAFGADLSAEGRRRNRLWPQSQSVRMRSEREIKEQRQQYLAIAKSDENDAQGLMRLLDARYADMVRWILPEDLGLDQI